MARVAPATLAGTFTTSVAPSYALLAMASPGPAVPDWWLGLTCGLGGLGGGYRGAYLQLHPPETALRLQIGTLAAALGAVYAAQTLG
ncbi:hypothetical protein [Streptomyces gardneri]|uniref:hypothetical protein n=1 Tax=Streptomyces gardneri TaxID=66892 RepID=UPI003F4D293A